jgi:hypothetical protein
MNVHTWGTILIQGGWPDNMDHLRSSVFYHNPEGII